MSDFTELNRQHFNASAATYNKHGDNVFETISSELQKRLDWIGADWTTTSEDEDVSSNSKSARLLDYACGTGMVSRSLAPYLTRTQGLDISASMVEQYNLTSRNQNLYPLEMFAVEGNLLDANNPSPESLKAEEWWEFEIAAVGLGFHHFEDPRFAARQLARRLKKGGVLLVIDFCSHAPIAGHHTHAHEHEHEHGKAAPEKTNTEKFLFGPGESNEETKTIAATVKHHGFSEDEMREIFTDAGVGGSFGYSVIEKDITFKTATKSMVRRVFVCKGTKM